MVHPPSLDVPAKQMHSVVPYKHYLYIFGGCFAFNKLRNTRESTNSIFEYNTQTSEIQMVKTHGQSIAVRKQHTAVTFKDSMVVFGGSSDNGFVQQDMLVYNFNEKEWNKIWPKGQYQYFYQGGACAVR